MNVRGGTTQCLFTTAVHSSMTTNTTMSDSLKKLFPRAYFSRLIENNARSDGRSLMEVRKTRIVNPAITSADASALCTIGRTSVICGIRYEIGPPITSKLQSGRVEVRVELGGLCSPNPSETFSNRMEQAIRRMVDSGFIDLEDLCIQEGKAVWVLKCHLICLDDDGNLVDGCLLAFTSAIQEMNLPYNIVLAEDGSYRILSPKTDKKVKTRFIHPTPLTLGIFDHGQIIIADPSAEEEAVLEALITVIMDSQSGDCTAVIKYGGPSISIQQLSECMEACKRRKILFNNV